MEKKFIMMMCIPAAIILGFILFKMSTLITGQDILLEIPRPIDPTDLFRGNYVTLWYTISNIDLSEITYDYEFSRDETVYAILSKKEKFWTVDSVSHSKPKLNENQVCLKGKVGSSRDNQIRVKWGIESFFSPPEQAKEIEKEKWSGNVSSIVTVDSYCDSVLRALVVKDEIIKTK